MFSNGHGGECCGINHIHSFGNNLNDRYSGVNKLDSLIQSFKREGDDLDDGDRRGLIECVLTDQQMERGWAPEMKKRGFRLVTRFYNSNSGNYCNVLHLTTRQPRGKLRRERPFKY